MNGTTETKKKTLPALKDVTAQKLISQENKKTEVKSMGGTSGKAAELAVKRGRI